MPTTDIRARKETKVRSLTIIPTKACNLRCTYCYEKDCAIDNSIMDIEVAKDAIRRYLDSNDEYDGVLIDFFGGEPLLAFPFVKDIVDWVQATEWKKAYHFSIGTNGTLLSDEIKHWPNQPAKMTICAENIPYVADSVIELEEMGLFFSANVAGENFWGNKQKAKNLLEQYSEQLILLVDYYAQNSNLIPVYRILDSLPPYLEIPTNNDRADQRDCTRFCGAGHEMVTLDVDGTEYPCHRFLPWVTGKPAPMEPTNIQSQWKPEQCSNCKIINICPTCAGYNWEVNNDTGIRTTYHCEATKIEVLASAKLALLRMQKNKLPKINSLPIDEQKKLKQYVDVLWEMIEDGI